MINKLFTLSLILFLAACTQPADTEKAVTAEKPKSLDEFNVFQKERHILPGIEKEKFETLKGWDFCWAILQPINKTRTKDHEKQLAKRFSPGQKALYFELSI